MMIEIQSECGPVFLKTGPFLSGPGDAGLSCESRPTRRGTWENVRKKGPMRLSLRAQSLLERIVCSMQSLQIVGHLGDAMSDFQFQLVGIGQ